MTSLTILIFTVSGFSQDNKVYDYLTMVKMRNILHISIGSEGHQKININDELVDDKELDNSTVNKRISEYELQGWQFVSASQKWAMSLAVYEVVMRRPKE